MDMPDAGSEREVQDGEGEPADTSKDKENADTGAAADIADPSVDGAGSARRASQKLERVNTDMIQSMTKKKDEDNPRRMSQKDERSAMAVVAAFGSVSSIGSAFGKTSSVKSSAKPS